MSAKTVATSVGDVELAISRDRDGSFTPMLVPNGSRRVGGLDDMIVSLYAGGMTVRDIEHHLVSTIGTDISRETISKMTDEVGDEVMAWQHRPLASFYPGGPGKRNSGNAVTAPRADPPRYGSRPIPVTGSVSQVSARSDGWSHRSRSGC